MRSRQSPAPTPTGSEVAELAFRVQRAAMMLATVALAAGKRIIIGSGWDFAGQPEYAAG